MQRVEALLRTPWREERNDGRRGLPALNLLGPISVAFTPTEVEKIERPAELDEDPPSP